MIETMTKRKRSSDHSSLERFLDFHLHGLAAVQVGTLRRKSNAMAFQGTDRWSQKPKWKAWCKGCKVKIREILYSKL